MKKLLFIFSFLFCALISMAQLPSFPNNNLNNSNTATLFGYQGGLTSNGYKLKQFADTATANAQLYLKFTPHLMIKVGNNIYVRNTAATQWVLVGGNFILNPGVDSVTLYGNTLCQWVSGVPTCYALNNSSNTSYSLIGDFIYDSLLYFHNTPYQYYILGRYFTAPYTSHLLNDPNPSAGRVDVGYVDSLNSAGIIQGINGGGAQSTNPVSQMKIGEVHINAADTIPNNFSNRIVYRFNNEWSGVSTISGVDFGYTTAPFSGTSVSTYIPSFVNDESLSYTNDTLVDISTASYLKFRIWLNSSFTAANLNFSFYNLDNVASSVVPLLNGQFGYNSATVGSWQEINIPMAYFQLYSYYIDEVVIGLTGANASGFKIGNIVIQYGGSTTSSSTTSGVIKYNGRDGFVLSLRTDNHWAYDSTAFNADSSFEYHYANSVFLDSTWTGIINVTDTCFIIDTTGGGRRLTFNQNCGGSGSIDSSKWTLSGSDIYNKNSGNVGINDATPSEKLEVNGSINISAGSAYKYNGYNVITADIALGNYYFGPDVGNFTAEGIDNIAVGNLSMQNNTEGEANSSLGYRALRDNITGYSNVAVGHQSLMVNTDGYNNTAVGAAAISVNTIGFRNTGIGHTSLVGNTTGSSNVGLGYKAGGYNTTGSDQIFINSLERSNYLGDTTKSPIWIQQDATVASQRIKLNGMVITPVDAYVNTVQIGRGSTTRGTDSLNILIGREALFSNTSGYKNIAIGDSSLRLNTTGLGNTAIGVMSMLVSTTGHNNTAIGRDALKSNTTGGSNVGVGGSILTANTTGNGNIGIGTSVLAFNVTGSFSTGIGFSSLSDNTASFNTGIGSYAGRWNTSAANQIFINGINRTDYTGDTTDSPIYIKQNATVASQIIKLNGIVQIPIGAGASKILTSDASGYATWETPSAGSVAWGAITGTLSDQTDLNTALGLKAPLASPTFTGTVTIPTPFTLGATSVTATGTQLNYLNAATGTTGTASTNLVFSTTPTFTTNITTPLILAGTGTTQTFTYQTTSGVGATGADHIWKVGNNGATELMRGTNAGNLGIGMSPNAGVKLDITNANNDGLRVQTTGASSLALSLTSADGRAASFKGKANGTNGIVYVFALSGNAGDMLQLQNSSGTSLSRFDVNANLAVNTSAAPTSVLQSGGSFSAGYVAKTATYTATISDYTIECTANTFTVTLPTAVGITGRIYNVVNSGAGTITVGTTSSQTFINVVATPTTLTLAAVGSVMVQSNGANWMQLK